MVMEQLRAVGTHQVGSDLGRGRAPDHRVEGRDARPVAIIVKEPAGFARLQIFRRIGTGVGHVHFDPCGDLVDETGEQPAHQNGAVAGVVINMLLGDERMHGRRPLANR